MLTEVFVIGVVLGTALGATIMALLGSGNYEKGYQDGRRDEQRHWVGKLSRNPVEAARSQKNGLRRDFTEVSDEELLEYTKWRNE